MTVGVFKKILDGFNDTDRIIIDNGEHEANPSNEVIFAYKVRHPDEKEARPVVILQTRDDFDVPNELEAQMKHFSEENWDEADALSELFGYGFTLDDFKYDETRYEWAKRIAEKYGLV